MYPEHHPIRCVERAIAFIQNSLNQDIAPSLEAVASASHMSKYHFHRVYRILTGETCNETITRLRLARGADSLSDAEVSITDAAFTAGYASSQAFAKALKRELAMTATHLRADPERLVGQIKSLSKPNSDEGYLSVYLASLQPFEIITRRTTDLYPELNNTYRDLFELAGGPAEVEAIIGLPHGDIDTPEGLVFDCGLKFVTDKFELPDGYDRGLIEEGEYLSTRHIGTYARLPDTLDNLYRIYIAAQVLKLSDRPFVFHYLDDPEETNEKDLRTDIYLKLDTKHSKRA